MMSTKEDLLNEAAHMMYTEDIVESLKKTYASKAKRLEQKVEELQHENSQKDQRIAELEAQLENVK